MSAQRSAANAAEVRAEALREGVEPRTIYLRRRKLQLQTQAATAPPPNPGTTPALPTVEVLRADELATDEEPIKDLIFRRETTFQRRSKAYEAGYERVVRLPDNRPVGILHLGDPHVDDDGCDWPLLRQHVELVNATPGLHAATVGDMQNNWVGRLGRLYAHQSTTSRESWRLTEWLIKSVPWAYIVRGNHDAWTGDGDPLDYIIGGASCAVDAAYDARIKLLWPNGEAARLWARHDFPGRSQWARSHGQAKAAVLGGYPADVLVSGHRHCWESRTAERADGSVYHAIQVGAYKRMDSYAQQLGFAESRGGAAVMTIFDPACRGPGRVRVEWDIAAGASYLTWLRSRS